MEQTLPPAPTSPPATPEIPPSTDELARLRARVTELQRERDHLAAIVDILQEVSASLHFVDVLQTIAWKLGSTFGLDRCAIFLSGDKDEVRLVASYEDPSIRNLVVDLNRYPELKRAFESGETVFIPDAANDPSCAASRRPSTRATCAPSSSCRSAGRAPSSARSSCAPSARPSRSATPTCASARRSPR